MPYEHPPIRFLLDEHYPGWLADDLLAAGVDGATLTGSFRRFFLEPR
jgi:hypothetical protein